jgi:hydrogenase expression/formation protein HypC
MCLAFPGKIEELDGTKAVVSFGGIKRTVDTSFLEEPAVDQWVLVHVGYAIQTVDEEAARETYRLLNTIRKQDLENELNEM